jgi:hypothetical protein
MLLPLPTLAGLFEGRGLFDVLASAASAVAFWASAHAQEDPIADLTARVRHPLRWSLAHPIRAIVRRLR